MEQSELLKASRAALSATSAELAELLGVSPLTLRNWLLAEGSAGRREMPKTARLLLRYVLGDQGITESRND